MIIIGYEIKRRANLEKHELTEGDVLFGNRRVIYIEGILVSCGLATISVMTVALNHRDIAIN